VGIRASPRLLHELLRTSPWESRKFARLQAHVRSPEFILAHPAIASVIPGARSVAEVEENVALVKFAIPGELWAELKEDGLIAPAAPTPAGVGSTK
jgi:predicted aldo/keto reductase-like oxidoreductase